MINLRDMKRFARKCDVTKKGMNEGYVFNYGEMYASDKESAIKLAFDVYGFQSLSDAYECGICYYTEWEEVDEDFFFDADGNEYEL